MNSLKGVVIPISSTDSSLREEAKIIPHDLRSRVVPGIFVNKYGHIHKMNQNYTDGSSSEEGTGFGVFSETPEAFFKLRQPCSVFMAELAAIFYALLLIAASPPDQYFIFTDSLSAIEALKTPRAVKSPDYFGIKIVEVLGSMFKQAFRISLIWVPSHSGIPGNEKADSLAKTGVSEPFMSDPSQPMNSSVPHNNFSCLDDRVCGMRMNSGDSFTRSLRKCPCGPGLVGSL